MPTKSCLSVKGLYNSASQRYSAENSKNAAVNKIQLLQPVKFAINACIDNAKKINNYCIIQHKANERITLNLTQQSILTQFINISLADPGFTGPSANPKNHVNSVEEVKELFVNFSQGLHKQARKIFLSNKRQRFLAKFE